MIIESLSNNLIKHACALKQKKYRDEYGEFLAEGMRLVTDIALTARESVVRVFAAESALNGAGKVDVFAKSALGGARNELILVSEIVMKKLADTENSQGIVAVVKKREPKSLSANKKHIFLDRIRDPGNLGTIIRTAAAAGYSLILNDCADPYSPKVIRSCMGGIMSADFIESDKAALTVLKSNNYKIIAADLNGQNLFNAPKSSRICVVIGSEADGINAEIKALCDETVTIPMQNMESLNAAVSAGIIMYYYSNAERI